MTKARIMSASALGSRTPAEISTYLEATGWRMLRRTESVAFWSLPIDDGDELEIMQPLDRDLRDYSLRVGDVIAVLALAEGKSDLDILRQISEAAWDVHRLRMFPRDEPAGLIAMSDGVRAYRSLSSLIEVAAYPVFAGQASGRSPSEPWGLTEFLGSVRIGPAVAGSYVIPLYVPVYPRSPGQQSRYDETAGVQLADESMQQSVSLVMYRMIRAVHEAADATLRGADGTELLTESLPQGMGARLCEALIGFGGRNGHGFEFSVTLAAARPDRPMLEPLRFREDHVPVLRQVSAAMSARTVTVIEEIRSSVMTAAPGASVSLPAPAEELNVSVTGEVVRLSRTSRTAGEVTVNGRVNESDERRKVRMQLLGPDYELAVLAHQQMRPVTVRGDLVRRGTQFRLSDPTEFRVLNDADAG